MRNLIYVAAVLLSGCSIVSANTSAWRGATVRSNARAASIERLRELAAQAKDAGDVERETQLLAILLDTTRPVPEVSVEGPVAAANSVGDRCIGAVVNNVCHGQLMR